MSFPNRRNRNDENEMKNNPSVTNHGKVNVDKITAEGVFQSFLMLAQGKFSSADNVNRLDKIYNQSPEYKAEKDMLMRINNSDNSLAKGIAVGMGTFLILRRGPRIISRWMIQRHFSKQNSHRKPSSYEFDKSSPMNRNDPFQTTANNANNNKLQSQFEQSERPGLLFRSIKMGMDLFVSLSVAAYGAIYFTNTENMIRDVADIPLVEGRSLISDELCDDFYELYRHYPREIFEGTKQKNNTDVLLHSIRQFVHNCHKRQIYEHQILQQQQPPGWSTTEHSKQKHVYIPSPGVPRDIDVNIEWSNSYSENVIHKRTNYNDYQENVFDMQKETSNEFDIDTTGEDRFTIEVEDDISNQINFENEKGEKNEGKHQNSNW